MIVSVYTGSVWRYTTSVQDKAQALMAARPKDRIMVPDMSHRTPHGPVPLICGWVVSRSLEIRPGRSELATEWSIQMVEDDGTREPPPRVFEDGEWVE